MDPYKRIEHLEAEVKRLRARMEELHTGAGDPAAKSERQEQPVAHLVEDVRKEVDRALGVERGESLEERIGGVWFGRIAVLLIMTVIALVAAASLARTEGAQPWQKVAVGYGVALVCVTIVLLSRSTRHPFAQIVLGVGLAAAYFTSYAAFFFENMRVFEPRTTTWPLLGLCLGVMVATAYLRRDQIAASIGLFTVYYTIVASCTYCRSSDTLAYALIACAALALVVLAFHVARGWRWITWLNVLATYFVLFAFFRRKPHEMAAAPEDYFWLAGLAITACFAALAVAIILDGRKSGSFTRMATFMSVTNSLVYLILMWGLVGRTYPEHHWVFLLGLAACLAGLSALAETAGDRRNYLFQFLLTKAVVLFSLAIVPHLIPAKLWTVLAVEAFVLAIGYGLSGIVVLKVLGLVLMLVAFVGCVPEASLPGTLLLAGQAIPANWFCCAGVSIVFLACSWFFQQFPLRREPARRTVSGHWFLADSFLDITSGTAALLYAAAAALLLLTVTVFDLAEHAALPYILSAEGLLLLLFGYLTRTPQAKMAGALLLIGAHVTYQLLLWMGHPPFDEFGAYDHVAVAMAVATLGAGVAWERFLARAPRGKTSIDHVVASIPFLAGAYMLTSLSARDLQAAHAALLQNGLGVGLLMMAYIAGSAGAVAGGTLALAVGTATYFGWLFQPESTIANDPRFLPILAAMLLTYAVSERVLRRSYPPQTRLSHASDMVRSALVAAAGTLGILSLNQWAPDHQLTLFWLAHAVLGMALGVLFRESRYRWAALLIFAVAISRAVLYDLRALPLHYQILSFAALMAVFLAVSRAYLKYREKTASGTRPRRSGESSIHG